MTEAQKTLNHEKSKGRPRVSGTEGVRTMGLDRARMKIGMMNRVYNRVRLGQLLKRDRKVVPAVA